MADEFREMKDEMKADLREMADDFGRMRNEIARETAAMKHELAADRAQRNAERVQRRGGDGGGEDFVVGAFFPDMRPVMGVATVEATNRASATVEAEHFLLAFLFARTSNGAALLGEYGLTYETFSQALQQEREQTLAAIGIRIPDASRLQAAPRVRMGRPRFGASAKEAFERASKLAKARRGRAQRLTDLDFLAGILAAELGTVPRALIRGGFDRQQLLDAALASITTPRKDSK